MENFLKAFIKMKKIIKYGDIEIKKRTYFNKKYRY